jgi:hypothetical protein
VRQRTVRIGSAMQACDVCGGSVREDAIPNTCRCISCGFMRSAFPVRINEIERIDEDARALALKPLRTVTFREILDDVAQDVPPPASVLDVGSAHGWFMEEAERRGYVATGIEPDATMAARSRVNVIRGFFPEAAQGPYDLVTFNDVFEHLPEPSRMMRATVINLPVSDGMIFKITRFAARLGLRGPLERMWQKGLPSPHLSYFSAATLERLAGNNGLTLIRKGRLTSIVPSGLWRRIRYDREVGLLTAGVLYVAALALAAICWLAPADIQYFIFKRA